MKPQMISGEWSGNRRQQLLSWWLAVRKGRGWELPIYIYPSFHPSIRPSSLCLKAEWVAVLGWITCSWYFGFIPGCSPAVAEPMLGSIPNQLCLTGLPVLPENATVDTAVSSRGWASKLQPINPRRSSRQNSSSSQTSQHSCGLYFPPVCYLLVFWQCRRWLLQSIYRFSALPVAGRSGASGLLLFRIPGIADRRWNAVLTASKIKVLAACRFTASPS